LRDWRGHSTLLNPRPDYINGEGPDGRSPKPTTRMPLALGQSRHRRFRSLKSRIARLDALLESEFDWPTPLMELDSAGQSTWSQLIWKITRA
jgi:hypothetical protein